MMIGIGEREQKYFTDYTYRKGVLYTFSAFYVASVSIIAIVEPLISLPCDKNAYEADIKYDNPVYNGNPCLRSRYAALIWFTREECSFARRLVSALLLGGLIGWERRQADRPAGIRTMALVSLGSALFTICSTFAFLTGQNEWDASRISAAIPSGVGFLGAGLIFKENKKTNEESESGATHVVHGLTTAASLWLSAAVGIACGGELYFAATFGTAIMLLLLRFGPRGIDTEDDDNSEEEQQDVEEIRGETCGESCGPKENTLQNCALSERSSLMNRQPSYLTKKSKGRANLAIDV